MPMIPSIGGVVIGKAKAATNLISNGGFETNATGWTARNATETISRITSWTAGGAGAGNILLTAASAGEGAYHAFTGAASTQYTASVTVLPDSGVTARIYLFDNIGSFVAGESVAGDGTTVTRLKVTATTAGGSSTFRVYVRCETAAQATKNIKFDAVQVEAGPAATPYVPTDGATASRTAMKWVA